MGCPDGWWDVDGNPLTGTCGCEYQCDQVSPSEDPIDEDFTDENCDGGDGLVEQCVYVSTSQGSDANAGTRMSPMQTIAAAIQQAQTAGVPSVCLSGELYQEAVTVVSGISIYGGFDHNDPDFKFRRKAGVITTVRATGTVLHAPQIDQETHIEGITIDALQASMAGSSTYGVRLGGGLGTLFVRYNIIAAAGGRNGTVGINGLPVSPVAPAGNDGQAACDGCSGMGLGGPPPACTEFGGKGGDGGFNNSDGQAGSVGSGNAPGGSAGNATEECFSVSGSGGPGGSGADGAQGMPGAGGAPLGTIVGGLYFPAGGGSGQDGTNGKGAGGGGGGAGGSECVYVFNSCVPSCNADRGGGGGSGGCGGLGGTSGSGAQGGGGSFGVFAAGGSVIVTDNTITTGPGGQGGTGGNGRAGQLGGQGGQGGPGIDDAGSGNLGGNGGDGGAGGPGGGGGGGPSACLARSGATTFSFSGNTCVAGIPGFGGAGGTNPDGGVAGSGQNGTSAPNLQIN
jgi:hypothetical protein